MEPTAIYVHIPFCDHKCIYCDFYSIINEKHKSEYLDAILSEIEYYSKKYSKSRIIKTIFFGGGTPSYMEPEYISEIIKGIKKHYNVSNDCEITLETNPGTVSRKKLRGFLYEGINRISIGVQSFDEKELKFLTRIHDRKSAIDTVNTAYEEGFKNISIDLIFSLPKQSQEIWLSNLKTAINLPINHISAYNLILERGTILNRMVLDGKIKLNTENYDADLYELTIDFLTNNGFKQYEVSNFAKPGFECTHNKYYWEYKDYLSFGTSAHSFIKNKRWWNYSSLTLYIERIKEVGNAVCGNENLEYSQMKDEYIMLSLRSCGINLIDMEEKFSSNWYIEKKNLITQYINDGYLKKESNQVKCTKKGYLVCDELISKLL